jgi:allantoinase
MTSAGAKFFITSRSVCAENRLQRLWIEVENGEIKALHKTAPTDPGATIKAYDEFVILPGLVDSHVHVNEPGRTEWEGFETATHAAAAGGATTLVDMPLNCIPVTTSKEALHAKLEAVKGKLSVDVGFWGGATSANAKELPALLDAGVLGVKTFTIDSGIPEFPPMSMEGIDKAMPELAKRGLPYLFHAELDDGENRPQGPDYATFLHSRPRSWEENAIEGILKLAKKHNASVHIVHLSAASAIPKIEAAKKDGVRVTVETCPHYLLLSDTQVNKFEPANQRTLFKCCPPIREESNRAQLWEGLLTGAIDMVVSDHSPCTPALKKFETTDFGAAWGGIAGLQYTLPLIWTEGQRHAITFPQLTKWLCEQPAKLAGLENRKGKIAPGFDADFAVFDSNVNWNITPADTFHRHKGSPYLGRRVMGKVVGTYLRGEKIYEEGKFPGKPRGEFLLKDKK